MCIVIPTQQLGTLSLIHKQLRKLNNQLATIVYTLYNIHAQPNFYSFKNFMQTYKTQATQYDFSVFTPCKRTNGYEHLYF